LPNTQRRASEKGSFRAYEAADAGSESGGRRRAPFEGDGKVRDLGNWERKGPLSPIPGAAPGAGGPREGGRTRTQDGPRERKLSPSWGEGRSEGRSDSRGEGRSQENHSQDGSRPPRREFADRPPPVDRTPTAAELNNQWRATMKPDAAAAAAAAGPKSPVATPESSTPASPAQASLPTGRPRLNLQKRTVSTADPAGPSSASDSKSSPFGAAKPIDTAAREAEVEEKRQLAIRSRREAEEKQRQEEKERRASESAASKSDQRKTDRTVSVSNESSKGSAKEEANEDGEPASKPNFEILRRVEKEEGDAEDDGAEENVNGAAAQEKQPKSQAKATEPKKAEGSWRKPPAAAASETTPTTDAPEGEGWSTVPSNRKDRSRRGGQNAARTVAS